MPCAAVLLQVSACILVMQHQPIAVPEVLHDDMNAGLVTQDYDWLSIKSDRKLGCSGCFAQDAAPSSPQQRLQAGTGDWQCPFADPPPPLE